MENNLFEIPDSIADLINFAQFTKSLEVPTTQGGTIILFSLLWEGELADITRKSADYANPQDMMSRSNYIKLETLVQAINKIGDVEYTSVDPEEQKIKKNNLRMTLQKCSPALVKYLHDVYRELVEYRDKFVISATEEYKKKFQTELMGESQEI